TSSSLQTTGPVWSKLKFTTQTSCIYHCVNSSIFITFLKCVRILSYESIPPEFAHFCCRCFLACAYCPQNNFSFDASARSDRLATPPQSGRISMSIDTLNDIFFAIVGRENPRVTMHRKASGEWVSTSSRELYRNVAGVARALLSWGIAKGDRVAILGEN